MTPGRDAEGEAGAVFAALADPTRRAVLRDVAEQGPLTATELADRLPVTRQAIAKHLAVLQEAGLVEPTRGGTGEPLHAPRPAAGRRRPLAGRHRVRLGRAAGPAEPAPARPATRRLAPEGPADGR